MNETNLVWIDLEMTGLDVEKNRIIEIATIVTDKNLTILAEGPVMAIYQEEDILKIMDNWNVNQHTKSGLIDRVKKSKYHETEAQKLTLELIKQYVPKGKSPLCGNSVCTDRRFLARYMPELENYFHYRLLDVSTLKELAIRWMPDVYDSFKKEGKHLALEDIKESINELKHYRQHLFVPGAS